MNINVQELFSLEGKIALLTGATGHFGSVFSHALCQSGATVVLVARDEMALRSLKNNLSSAGHNNVHIYPVDLLDDSGRESLCNFVIKETDGLDILINNAYSGVPGTIQSATPEQFDTAYSVAVTAAFRLVQLLESMLEQGASQSTAGASVINVASMYGVVSPDPGIYGDSGSDNPPYYGAAKAGLIQLTRYLACHLADKRIRVNSISPGAFPPGTIKDQAPEFFDRLCAKTPLGRIGQPEELIGALLFLASGASSYVTGCNLPVDGGWTAW